MKWQRLMIGAFASTLAFSIACERKPRLDNDKAKLSYAIGQNIAKNIKSQAVDIDPKVVGYALSQGLIGEKPEVTEEEQQKAIQDLQKASQEKAMAEMEKNKGISAQFMAKNKERQGVKVTPSGLQYEILKAGQGKKPTLKDKVTVHYTGTLATGQKFDSSHDRGKPAEFPVNGIIKGWQEALQMMPEGSVYKLYIPPEIGYGAQGQPGIPPNSVLVFDVELIKVDKAK